MAADDWYRQTEWTEQSAALFEEKIARARSQKAQYFAIQAILLWPKHPDVALALAERGIAASEEGWIDPRLPMARAYARLQLGQVDAVLAEFEQTIALQRRQGGLYTSAALDYVFTAAYFEREDHYEKALAILDDFRPGSPFPNTDCQALGALAMILTDMGDSSVRPRELARAALDNFVDFGQPLNDDMYLGGISVIAFRDRLEKIASG